MATALLQSAQRRLHTEGHSEAELSEASREAQEAAAQFRRSGQAVAAADAVCTAASALVALGNLQEATQLAQRELNSCTSSGDKAGEAVLLWLSAGLLVAQGQAAEALPLLRQAKALLTWLPSNRADRLEAQLLVAQANAFLAGGEDEAQNALRAAAEAAALCRRGEDRAGEGEALHAAALAKLLQQGAGAKPLGKTLVALEAAGLTEKLKFRRAKAEQSSITEELPLSSLEEAEAALQVLQELGDKEGEAAILAAAVAPAHMSKGDSNRGAVAAKRALTIFRDLAHRKGRQVALRVLGQACHRSRDLPSLLEAATEETRQSQQDGDVAGVLTALSIITETYIDAGEYGEALSAAVKGLKMLRELKATEAEVGQLLVVADLQRLLGRMEPATNSAEQAVAISAELATAASGMAPEVKERVRQLALQARRSLSSIMITSGQPNKAPNRSEALDALAELSHAAKLRDGPAFQEALSKLNDLQGFTEKDVRDALLPSESEKDASGLARFLRQQGQLGEKTGPAMVMQEVGRASLYLFFRSTGLGYGPRFRTCRPGRVLSYDGSIHTVASLRVCSTQEDWGRDLQYHPGILDGMQHALTSVAWEYYG